MSLCPQYDQMEMRPLINIKAASSRAGSMFLKAFDTSGNIKDAEYVAYLFQDVIGKEGFHIVIQIITGNAAHLKAVDLSIEAKITFSESLCHAYCEHSTQNIANQLSVQANTTNVSGSLPYGQIVMSLVLLFCIMGKHLGGIWFARGKGNGIKKGIKRGRTNHPRLILIPKSYHPR